MGRSTMLRTLASRGLRSVGANNSRSMATQAPLRLHGLDGRYATSLWKVASEKGELAKVEADLANFQGAMGSEVVKQLLTNPSIPKLAKKAAVNDLMKKVGYAESTKNFFFILAENGRLAEFAKIMGKFDELQRAAKGEVHAEVTVADDLTAAQKKSLEKSLKGLMGGSAKMSLEVKVKPEILGGLIIDVGDKHINMSILARIQQLQNVINMPIA